MSANLFRVAGISSTNPDLEPTQTFFRDVVEEEQRLIIQQRKFRQVYDEASLSSGTSSERVAADQAAGDASKRNPKGLGAECYQAENWFQAAESIRSGASSIGSDETLHGARPFSLAFSGGGIRAAAFQSGVLWRLAQAGLLKDVDYLAAVSGGAYIASSYASHLRSTPPPTDSHLDDWYSRVVAQVVCRMQRNAGDFVRDPSVDRKWWRPPDDGSSTLPRVFDLPQLVVVLVITLFSKPLQILCLVLVPMVEIIFHFFGASLRAAFCARGKLTWQILLDHSPWIVFLRAVEALVVISFVLTCILRLRPFRAKVMVSEGQKKPNSHQRFLYVNGLNCFVQRLLGVVLLTMWIVLAVAAVQVAGWDTDEENLEWRHTLCDAYTNSYTGGYRCEDMTDGQPWWQQGEFANLSSYNYTHVHEEKPSPRFTWQGSIVNSVVVWVQNKEVTIGLCALIFMVTLVVFSAVVVPWRPDFLVSIFSLIAPLAYVALLSYFLQERTFKPITGMLNREGLDGQALNEWWDLVMQTLYYTGLVFFLFYDQWHKLWHVFYKRSLRRCFFAGGRDMLMIDLAECLLCPVLILTGTVVDYKPLASEESIAEISFTQLHTGSIATGYIRTPHYRTLSKAMALSGAGCLDAITLSMTHRLRFRVWLEMLNLAWGDYILFPYRDYERKIQRVARKAGRHSEETASWVLYQLPTAIIYLCFFFLFRAAWIKSYSNECDESRTYFIVYLSLVALTFMLSFFAFSRHFFFMSLCPMVRNFHQLTQYFYRDFPAPGMLYVTDGGVRDCTGIIQLMLRRRRRILLALAGADPEDELGVLRTAMAVAVEKNLGSFYDPDNHRRNVNLLLDDFGKDKSRTHLRLGIYYGSCDEGGRHQLWHALQQDPNACVNHGDEDGELLIVKNRLPPSWSDWTLQPLLSEGEIRGTVPTAPDAAGPEGDGMRYKELGGLGCCDGCHRCGCNYFAKFPHLTGANYLWLTPTLFSGLSRLGHCLCGDLIPELLEPYASTPPVQFQSPAAPAAEEPPGSQPPRQLRQRLPVVV